MTYQKVPSSAEPRCTFCDSVVHNGAVRKLKMNDGTRREGLLCDDCNPSAEGQR